MAAEDYEKFFEMTTEERKQSIHEHPSILDDILAAIGHEDAAIRDQLNYRLFIMLLSENALGEAVINGFVSKLSSTDGLLFMIGEKGTSCVFQRSYAALFLAAIVNADRQLNILTSEQLELLAQNAAALLTKEQDLRSFVDSKSGWAHSVANTTELISAIIAHPLYPIRYTSHILQAIRANIWKGYVFTDDEEERFCSVIQGLLAKNIDEALFIEWFEQLFDQLEMAAFERGYDALWFKARTNQLNVAKTLYFYLKFADRNEKLRSIVSTFIQRWLKLN